MARDDIGTVKGMNTNSINRSQAAGSPCDGYGKAGTGMAGSAANRVSPNAGSRGGGPAPRPAPKSSMPDRKGEDGGSRNMKAGMSTTKR
jgi:hypothetical protein